MKILVTGGAGFIGSHLTDRLLEDGHLVTIYDNYMRGEENEKNVSEVIEKNGDKNINIIKGDILEFEKLKTVVKENDFVFHLAALPSHRLALNQPREYAMVDVAGTVNVLEASRLSKQSPPILFASSNKVYGKVKPPFVEDMELKPQGPYGLAKLCSEQFCKMYVDYYDLDVSVIRYHHVIGPRCQPDREISIFTERVLNNQSPIVHGTFKNDKFISCAADYTNIYDAVEATVRATKLRGFDTFNLATGKVTTVLKLAELVIEGCGAKNIKPEFKEMLAHESLIHQSDVSKIKKELDFEAKISVEDSVKQYLEWRLRRGPREQAVYKI